MSENEITLNDELEFLHQDPYMGVRYIFALFIVGIVFCSLIRFSFFVGWAPLLIGFLLGTVQRIHKIDGSSITVSNYFGIGISFLDLWHRLFLSSKGAIDGTNPIQVSGENRYWWTDFASGREKFYHVKIKCESGYVVLSTYKSRSAAQKKAAEIKRFLIHE